MKNSVYFLAAAFASFVLSVAIGFLEIRVLQKIKVFL